LIITNFFAGLLLFSNVTLLAILVPGGPIEKRDFSNLKGITFWGFNIFLISLGLATFVNVYLLFENQEISIIMGIIISIFYMFVYLLDLGKIFPKSPTKMSNSLMLMEIINLMISILSFIFLISIY